MTLHGQDLLTLPPDRFWNFVYCWSLERVKDREKFIYDLTRPLPGQARQVTDEQLAAEGRDFMAFAGALGLAPKTGAGRTNA